MGNLNSGRPKLPAGKTLGEPVHFRLPQPIKRKYADQAKKAGVPLATHLRNVLVNLARSV